MKKYIVLILWIVALTVAAIVGYNNYDVEALISLAEVALLTSAGIMAYTVYQRGKSKEELKKAVELENTARKTHDDTITECLKLKNETMQFLEQAKQKEVIVTETSQTYPWLATLISSYNEKADISVANYLVNKPHPAYETAVKIREISKQKRIIETELRQTQHQLLYYETVFPWLEEFKELDPREAYSLVTMTEGDDEYEYLRHLLSPEEYNRLPTVEKYQRALDRYKARKKTNWEAGIDYERYIGFKFEQEGYSVKYVGATLGLEDMGRDLIGTKSQNVKIIQCKRWAKDKTIHEKHIFQLYGSVVHWTVEHPEQTAMGIFVTTTLLSPVAKKCADYLGVEVWEKMEMPNEYPIIKCHVTKPENIYHLPFDQQYDRTLMSEKDGDIYVSTVKEAEELGFRRAYRWRGTNKQSNT